MRAITSYVKTDLQKKMVFIGGPIQCGKTTLAEGIMADMRSTDNKAVYFNWDDDVQRQEILARKWLPEDQLLVFDELHKLKKWKSWIKGIYDTQKSLHQFLVTGSARMDVCRKGGDSLLGRYHYWRLHPFTLSEIPAGISPQEAYLRLLQLGGFPEPFLSGDEKEARRWRKARIDRVIRDDIRDLESVRDIKTLELLVSLLRARVGGPIVVKNLAEDLQISQPTVKHWLEVLEKMYLIFLVYPYSEHLPRAILKPPKAYFFDNADVDGDIGARFENLVATHLLKSLHFLEDRDGFRYDLRYIADKEGREVDFILLKEKKIVELIEVKWSDTEISPSLRYYHQKLKPPFATQIIGHPNTFRGFEKNGIRVISALDDLIELERKSLVRSSCY